MTTSKAKSLKLNVAATYCSQFYVILISIALIPEYLRMMGAESYGLIAFYSMVQNWFIILDLGLTLTVARESARYFGGALPALDYVRLYRSLGVLFFGVAVAGGAGLVALSPVITDRWLHIQQVPVSEAMLALQVMGVSVAMRWMGGLYRGVVTGAEMLAWLSGFNALIATLRFALVFPVMAVLGCTIKVFFLYQLAVAALEFGILYITARRLVPRPVIGDPPVGWSFAPVALRLKFSLTIAFTSAIWIFVTQIDKLILSGILSLAQYGFFMLAVQVAGGITTATGPIGTAMLPRMARLYAEGAYDEMLRLYNRFAHLAGVVAVSLMVSLAVSSESLLFAWTGDREITSAAAPILRLYAIGNGLLAVSAFPFYLQYARGNLRYHLIGNIGMAVLVIPAIVFAALRAGGVGVGWVWVAMNLIYLFYWVAFVHGRLEPGLHAEWIRRNFLSMMVPTSFVGVAIAYLHQGEFVDRSAAILDVVLISIACLTTACLGSSEIRIYLLRNRLRS